MAPATRETYEAALVHIKARLGTFLVCDVTARDIADYQNRRAADGAAGAAVNKEVTCISSILSDHGVWARIRRDVKRLPENEEAGRALETAEERMLLEKVAAAGGAPGQMDAAIHRHGTSVEYWDETPGDSHPAMERHRFGDWRLARRGEQDEERRRPPSSAHVAGSGGSSTLGGSVSKAPP